MIVKSWPFVTQDITSESAPKMFNSTDCFQPSNAFLCSFDSLVYAPCKSKI